jgi:hypothetical protein
MDTPNRSAPKVSPDWRPMNLASGRRGRVARTLIGMTLEVILESEVPEVERAAVAEVFESAGIQADVKGAYIRRSADLLPWIIEITAAATVARFTWAAVAGAGDEAGRDAWKALKRLITSLYEARRTSRAPQGGVNFRDSEAKVEIQLPPDLPDAAYRRLWEIENPVAPLSGILRWDNDLQDWTDVFTGQYRCFYPGSCAAPATQSRVRHPGPGVVLSRLLCDEHAAASDAGDPAVWE